MKRYLEALNSRKRGRRAAPERLQEKIAGLEKKIGSESDPNARVILRQQRLDAQRDLKAAGNVASLEELERGFTKVGKTYSNRRGISYTAWREEGVPAEVLRKAGIARTRRRS